MKPAIFNTNMVRAILDDQKTNTRRLDKNFPDPDMSQLFNCGTSKDGFLYAHFSNGKAVKAPYKVGDIIYVRETFCPIEDGTVYRADYPMHWTAIDAVYGDCDTDGEEEWVKWKPSIHMPKEYARLFLRVKDVRIERLNEISEEDAIKEGLLRIEEDDGVWYPDYIKWGRLYKYAKSSFQTLWESIYGKDSFDNRYVWVTEFERISKEEAMSETAT